MPQYTLKHGVHGKPRPELAAALDICAEVYKGWNQPLVVTSLEDGKHKTGSLHYKRAAADLRTSMLGQNADCVVRQLKLRLGPDFDVVKESDHIHIEFDPAHDGGKSLA
jgi:hypothetical protein